MAEFSDPKIPEPTREASRLSGQKLTRAEVWAEVKKHRGWYLLAFLLSGLPVYIATLWSPLVGSKTIPEWLAENGLPSLRVLIIAWVIVAAIIALVIVGRAYQTARFRQKTLTDPQSSGVGELVVHSVLLRTVGGSDDVEYIPEIKNHGIKVAMLLDNETIPNAELQNISGQVWTESKYLIATFRRTPLEFPWERDRSRLRYRIWLPVLPKMSHVWLPTLVFALPPPGEQASFGGEIVSKTSEFRQYRWWVANEHGKAVVHGGDATPDTT